MKGKNGDYINLSFTSYIKLYLLTGFTAGVFFGFMFFTFGITGHEASARANFGNAVITGMWANIINVVMIPVGFMHAFVLFALVTYPFFFLASKIIQRMEEEKEEKENSD